MTTSAADDPGLREARALADPTRAAIHRHLTRAVAPATIAELTALTSLHHTAVRQHLAKLEAAGLVERGVLPPHGRGRPRLVYRAVRQRADQPYRELARILADAVRTGRTPREVGHEAGRRVAPAGADAVEVLLSEARRLGFEPTLAADGGGSGPSEITLHACPYADLAAADPDTVCSIHLGWAEGVAAAAGGLVVDGIVPAPASPQRCRLRVHRA